MAIKRTQNTKPNTVDIDAIDDGHQTFKDGLGDASLDAWLKNPKLDIDLPGELDIDLPDALIDLDDPMLDSLEGIIVFEGE